MCVTRRCVGCAVPVSSRSARRRVTTAVAVLLVVAVAAAAAVLLRVRSEQRLDDAAAQAAERYAQAAERGDLSAASLTTDPVAAQEAYAAAVAGLGEAAPEVEVLDVDRDGDSGSGRLRWTWPFGPDGWRYETALSVSADGDAWAAVPDLTAVHPQLTEGATLDSERVQPERAPVLGRDGEPLVTATALATATATATTPRSSRSTCRRATSSPWRTPRSATRTAH